MDFTCNVCGRVVRECPIEQIDREVKSCRCGSTVRFRSVVHVLSVALYGRSIPLPQFPRNKKIVGLGMSDWKGYARPLAAKFSYTNTFFHCEPFYDVTSGDERRAGTCDFAVSTDVFEHVAPPIDRAFANAFDLLKPGGHFIFTVPWTMETETDEHFPHLYDYRIVRFDNDAVLVNRTRDGDYELYRNLVFHGGPGETLEMRVFSKSALETHLSRAGFLVQTFEGDASEFGIIHKHLCSLPMLATKPQGKSHQIPFTVSPPLRINRLWRRWQALRSFALKGRRRRAEAERIATRRTRSDP